MNKYILQTDKYTAIATYTNSGKLKHLEAKKGVLLDVAKAGHDFAYLERDVDSEYWKPHQPKKDAFFTPAQKAWMEFFNQRAGFAYYFTAIDAGAIKNIGKALIKISNNTEEALEVWRYLLKNWDALPDFYRNKPEPKFIASQLNTILNLLKNGKNTSQATTAGVADDLRRSFQS